MLQYTSRIVGSTRIVTFPNSPWLRLTLRGRQAELFAAMSIGDLCLPAWADEAEIVHHEIDRASDNVASSDTQSEGE